MVFLLVGIFGLFLGFVILILLCNFAVNTHRYNKISNLTGISKESPAILSDLSAFFANFKFIFRACISNFGFNKVNFVSKAKLLFWKLPNIIKNISKTKNYSQIPAQFSAEVSAIFEIKINNSKLSTAILPVPILQLPFKALPANQTATISFLANEKKPLEQLSIFEKKEVRILKKFEETSLEDYSIWSELGVLYEENKNNSKAIEIYSFILKHAKGDLKENAKNRLISLS